ncbi:MAG: transposase family protein [Thermaerobacter sp.]|nr:transposase family protein [Thermaerobacter sp.]
MRRPARYWLAADFEAPELVGTPTPRVDLNRVPLEGAEGLLAAFAQVTDPRKKRGIRHSQTTVLAIAVGAVLAGTRSFLAIADGAQSLPKIC